MSTEKLAEVSVTLIYRHFLRALRTYPSVKQAQYIVACREGASASLRAERWGGLPEPLCAEFRLNAAETDPEKILRHKELALMELERLNKYSGMSGTRGDITLDL